jgi:hypothetical protein
MCHEQCGARGHPAQGQGCRLLAVGRVPESLGGQGLGLLGMSVFWHEISRTTAVPARDLNISATNMPSACRIANIDPNDAMILPRDANPRRIRFSERTGSVCCLLRRRRTRARALQGPCRRQDPTRRSSHQNYRGGINGGGAHGAAAPGKDRNPGVVSNGGSRNGRKRTRGSRWRAPAVAAVPRSNPSTAQDGLATTIKPSITLAQAGVPIRSCGE